MITAKVEPTITMKSEKAKYLGIVPELFSDFFAWDCRPTYLAVIRLQPKVTREHEAYTAFFESLKYVVTPVRVISPLPEMLPYLEKYGFCKGVEPCGTPYFYNKKYN